jgi:hypothetical protein
MSKKLNAIRERLEQSPKDKDLLVEFADLLFAEAMEKTRIMETESVDKLLNELSELALENSELKEIAKTYGKTIVNIIPTYFAQATLTQSKDLVNKFRSFVEEISIEELNEQLAMILTNAVYVFGLTKQSSSIHDFSMELIDLARKHKENITIQTASAKGLMNGIFYFIQNNDLDPAKDYFRRMMQIINANSPIEMVDSRKLLQLKEFFQYKE